jgi:hypothetical protein
LQLSCFEVTVTLEISWLIVRSNAMSPLFHCLLILGLTVWPLCSLAQSTEGSVSATKRRFRAHQSFDYGQKILFRSDFAKTDIDKLNLSEDANYSLPRPTPERIRIVDAPDLEGESAVRFFVPRKPNSFRAEISLPSEKGFQERWYGERMLVPKAWGFEPGKAADIVMQWHAIPGNWRSTYPNMSIAIQDKN